MNSFINTSNRVMPEIKTSKTILSLYSILQYITVTLQLDKQTLNSYHYNRLNVEPISLSIV